MDLIWDCLGTPGSPGYHSIRKIMEIERSNNQEQIMKTWDTRNHLKQIKSQLMDEMGVDAYHYFMQAGRNMFAQP